MTESAHTTANATTRTVVPMCVEDDSLRKYVSRDVVESVGSPEDEFVVSFETVCGDTVALVNTEQITFSLEPKHGFLRDGTEDAEPPDGISHLAVHLCGNIYTVAELGETHVSDFFPKVVIIDRADLAVTFV